MAEQVTFPMGDSGVDTNGTYGYATLPDGFVQRPAVAGYPLMMGSYAPDALYSDPFEYSNINIKYYFFPNQPERGVLMSGGPFDMGMLLTPDGSTYTNARIIAEPNLRDLVQFRFSPEVGGGTYHSPPDKRWMPTNNNNALYAAEHGGLYQPPARSFWDVVMGRYPVWEQAKQREQALYDIANAEYMLNTTYGNPAEPPPPLHPVFRPKPPEPAVELEHIRTALNDIRQ